MEVFNAPTGTGKSVLVRVLASWFALNEKVLTIVLPTAEATLAMAWEVTQDLKALGCTRGCTPLMSPNGVRERALKLASRIIEDPAQPGVWDEKATWKIDQLAYDCAVRSLTAGAAPQPGDEPCTHLKPTETAETQQTGRAGRRDRSELRSCPFMGVCGKFQQQRAACDASVVITNHANFIRGRMKIGVVLDEVPVASLPIAEFALRRSHAVVIDEVDQFQSEVISMCTNHLVLASRHSRHTPLQQLDDEQKLLDTAVLKDLAPLVSHARVLAESLLWNVCQGSLEPRDRTPTSAGGVRLRELPGMNSTAWHLSGSRDRRLIRLLFPAHNLTSDQDIPNELFAKLNALFPAPWQGVQAGAGSLDGNGAGGAPAAALEPQLLRVRELLGYLFASRGEDLVDVINEPLHEALEPLIADEQEREEAINLLIIRVWFTELDRVLERLRGKTAQLRAAGLDSARRLAEDLDAGVAEQLLPHGLLGRAIHGYRITGLDDLEHSAELTSQVLTGDPHTYTAQLGGTIALCLAGVERPVMGLSATAYFPEAVREHVHAPVKWWMTDADAASIRARDGRVGDRKISGLSQRMKKTALRELGTELYDSQIHAELAHLADSDPDRARALLVVNSYEQGVHLAHGIAQASRYTGRGLCVAVPSEPSRRERLPELPGGAVALTPEEFEGFADDPGNTLLIAPKDRVARGLNIVIGTQSAISLVYLCIRPLTLLGDPTQMYASTNAAGMRQLATAPALDPVKKLAEAREAAWRQLRLLLRSSQHFTTMRKEFQNEIVASMVIDFIQLAGRARRGRTKMQLFLVDYAFHDQAFQADFARILGRIYQEWPHPVRQKMDAIYREALNTFLAYAGIPLPTAIPSQNPGPAPHRAASESSPSAPA